MNSNCRFCSVLIEYPLQGRKIYCSTACRIAWWKKEDKEKRDRAKERKAALGFKQSYTMSDATRIKYLKTALERSQKTNENLKLKIKELQSINELLVVSSNKLKQQLLQELNELKSLQELKDQKVVNTKQSKWVVRTVP